MARNAKEYTILNAKNTTGVGNSIFVFDARHKDVSLATAGLTSGKSVTVKCQGSFSENAPTFSASKSVSNVWDYVQMLDLNDGTMVDGDTGVTFSTSNDVRLFSVNVDGLKWLSFEVTSITDSSVSITIQAQIYND